MLQNYLKIALRNLKKDKGYSLINVAGLAIGVAVCILIVLFVQHELAYDRFHEKADQIQRVSLKYYMGANRYDIAVTPCPLAEALLNDYPEVLQATRLYLSQAGQVYVRYGETQFKETGFMWADSTVFDVFTMPLIEGDPSTALARPHSVLVTPATAQKYFGDDTPIGKTLVLDDGLEYEVTGIIAPLPDNSHFHFDFLASFATHPKSRDPEWYEAAVATYIVLQKDFPAAALQAKFTDMSRKYVGPVLQQAMGISYDDFREAGNEFGFALQPLTDIHLYSEVNNEFEAGGDLNTVIVFLAIAILILIVACVNFINLATARSSQRANEVGVRKVVGSSRSQLVRQFLFESILLCAVAVALALLLVELALPAFNQLTGAELTNILLTDGTKLPLLLAFVLTLGCAAGAYPAFLLARFQPVTVLKGKIAAGRKGKTFRNLLVIFQFAASIALFVGTIVVYHQLQYLRTKDLGFDKDNLVVMQNAERLETSQQSFKNALLQNPDITRVTYSNCLPQMILETKPFQLEGSSEGEQHTLITIITDHDFLETYHLHVAEGRWFDQAFTTDTTAILLNRAAVRALNYDQPLGEKMTLLGMRPQSFTVIGVLDDFHIQPLHFQIIPLAVLLKRTRPSILLTARLQPGKTREALAFIEQQWSAFVPEQPLEYLFFDERFDQDYQAEIAAGRVLVLFAILAIFIASLGLFGLSSYTILRRTKEIGIRKVLGASIPGIALILSKEFTRGVLIANLIAWPVAWYFMSRWLQNFAYRIDLTPWPFVAAALLALLIAALTVAYQSIRAALSNPVTSLRYE